MTTACLNTLLISNSRFSERRSPMMLNRKFCLIVTLTLFAFPACKALEVQKSDYDENCPTLSPDGKYFFLNRRNAATEESNIYWVDAKIVEDLKPKELK